MNHYISKVKYYIKFCLGISIYGAPPIDWEVIYSKHSGNE